MGKLIHGEFNALSALQRSGHTLLASGTLDNVTVEMMFVIPILCATGQGYTKVTYIDMPLQSIKCVRGAHCSPCCLNPFLHVLEDCFACFHNLMQTCVMTTTTES